MRQTLTCTQGKQVFSILYHSLSIKMFTRMFTGNVYYVYYCSVVLGKLICLATEINSWWHAAFSFLPVSKNVKAVSCITDFGVSTAITTFIVGGVSWTLDSSIEAANCNTKLTKKVYFSSSLIFYDGPLLPASIWIVVVIWNRV